MDSGGVSLKILLEDINDVTCFVNGGNFYEGEIEVAQKRYRINGRSFIGMCSIENGKAEMIEEVESVFYECLIQLLFEKFEER